jgi:hypothetical protein
MRLALLFLPLIAACGSLGAFNSPHSEPPAPQLDAHQVRYKLLGHVTAKACAKDDEYDKVKYSKSPDPRAIGVGYLFERAKYEALEKVPTADGLFAIRAKVDVFANGQCTTITGRAYRITNIAAGPVGDNSSDETSEPPEETPARSAPNDQL